MGPSEGKKNQKSRTVPKKIERGDPSVSSAFANARKTLWLKQELEPVTAGFTVNRVKSTKKYIHNEVCGMTKKKEKKTSHCNSRALFTIKAPTKKSCHCNSRAHFLLQCAD